MSKKYAKRAGRSRRNRAKDLGGFEGSVNRDAQAVQLSLPIAQVLENVRSGLEDLCRNVKRWRPGDMAVRWAGTMLLEAQKRFRRLRGHRSMPRLLEVLGRSVASEALSA